MLDIAVLTQDPRFGGGGRAQTDAFVTGATALGRDVNVLSRPHPGLGARRPLPYRIEALHQLRTARVLAVEAAAARSVWVVATMAANGGAASMTQRAYACWIGTTLDSEWSGRAPGLRPAHRLAAGVSVPVLRRLERRVLRGATRIYATSRASRAAIASAAGMAETSIEILPIPIDVNHFRPRLDEHWLERLPKPVITFVGRADDPRKNLPLLLDAFRLVRSAIPAARLVLVGEPPHRWPDPGEGIQVLGQVADLARVLQRAHLLVVPSLQEGFGIVVAEALATGVPVVSTPCGGPEELIDASKGGLVTSTFDASELADTAVALLRDTERMYSFRMSGRRYVVEHHSITAFRALLGPALESLDRTAFASPPKSRADPVSYR